LPSVIVRRPIVDHAETVVAFERPSWRRTCFPSTATCWSAGRASAAIPSTRREDVATGHRATMTTVLSKPASALSL